MLGMLKLIRVFRIGTIIQNMKIDEEIKALLKILQLTLYLCIYLHNVGCLWFYVVDWSDEWIPPLNYIDAITLLYDEEGRIIPYQYAMSFYYSVLMFGGNEIGPTLAPEFLFASIFMVAAAIIQS